MRRNQVRTVAAGLAAVTFLTNAVPGSAYAAGAAVETDEAMYVNLDHYGAVDKVNVVKGYSLNGIHTITDYGTYSKVTNMSDYTEPVIGDGTVTWNLPEEMKGRFYFKGELEKEQVQLPWTFDVSYKLNGVPTNAEDLAGASGLVEIHVDATPNDAAKEYYRNNMILAVTVMADLNDCYSLEADGAQIQNIGQQTAAAFTALPGETGDFTVRIGSDSFETPGVIMAMIPGTVEDLEHIKDLKDAKDTWKDAGDEMYDSMDQMAASVEAMRDGVGQLQNGLSSAEAARQTVSGSKDGVFASNDAALDALRSLSSELGNMVPHIETAKEASEVARDSLGDIVNTMQDMQEPLERLDTGLRGVKSDSQDMADGISSINKLMKQIVTLDSGLQEKVEKFKEKLKELLESLGQISDDYYEEADLSDLELTKPDFSGAAEDGKKLLEILQQKGQEIERLATSSNALSKRLGGLLDHTADSARYTAELTVSLDRLIEDVTALHDSLDVYYPELQASLDDAEELVNKTTDALNKGTDALANVNNVLKDSSDNLDAAARQSIQGSMELLDKSLGVLDSTASMRNAGKTMKDTLDNEWNDLDTDNRFLYMDPSAEKISFTSEENEEPHTLQIILRTDEISLDDADDGVADAEEEAADEGPLARMWSVLVKMWNAIMEIFKDR